MEDPEEPDRLERKYTPHTSGGGDSKKSPKTFDVGVIIALPEEFNLFLKYIQDFGKEILGYTPKPVQFWSDDLAFWTFDLKNDSNIIQVVAHLVGEMGTEYTGIATNILIEKWKIPFIVNIGVTGSFSDELKVGSVLVPTQITHYTANWKAKDSHDSQSTEFLLGTRAFATNRLTLNQFSNYLTTSNYSRWQECCKKGLEGHEEPPQVMLGHLASGNIVVDGEHYKALLKASDRKLMACEMEAAGFSIAEQFLRAPIRMSSQFVSLRCISDMAANKAEAENNTHNFTFGTKTIQSREYAMRNATILFMFLIKDGVINASTDAQLELLSSITKSLEERKKSASKRVLQAPGQVPAELLKNISTQPHFKGLNSSQKRQIILHLGDKNTYDDKMLDSVGILLLQQCGRLRATKRVADVGQPASSAAKRQKHLPLAPTMNNDSSDEHEEEQDDAEDEDESYFENDDETATDQYGAEDQGTELDVSSASNRVSVQELSQIASDLCNEIKEHSTLDLDRADFQKIRDYLLAATNLVKKCK